jgi:hypothetical protein
MRCEGPMSGGTYSRSTPMLQLYVGANTGVLPECVTFEHVGQLRMSRKVDTEIVI